MAKPRQPVRPCFCHVIRKVSKALRGRPHRAGPNQAISAAARVLTATIPPCACGIAPTRTLCYRSCVTAQEGRHERGGGGANALALVQQRWDDLAFRRGRLGPAAAAALDELIRAYRQPHRHYHTLDHIAALLMLLESHADADIDRDALAAAILFHDVVYDPRRQDNEAASASLAARHLTSVGFPHGLVAKIVRCILATRHVQDAAAIDDADLALLLDLDLSILAAPRSAYRTYAFSVRREYAHVPDDLYRPGRRRVLEQFLGRACIYRTGRLRTLWEASARANLEAEIAELA
jgi:predicted metal-dependent HD superfamily phosphohydrolase